MQEQSSKNTNKRATFMLALNCTSGWYHDSDGIFLSRCCLYCPLQNRQRLVLLGPEIVEKQDRFGAGVDGSKHVMDGSFELNEDRLFEADLLLQ